MERAGFAALRDAAPAPSLTTPQADDDVLQLYTSGTTGLPKGVRLSNANYSAATREFSRVPRRQDERVRVAYMGTEHE